jgi:hypothetical protein
VSKWYIKYGSKVNHLLDDIKEPIMSFTADRGYDQNAVYRAVMKLSEEAENIIHPRSNAVLSEKGGNQRDRHVKKILDEGVHQWRRESGYYQQSKVENAFYRYTTIIGKKLRARTKEGREVEALIACIVLNRFTELVV